MNKQQKNYALAKSMLEVLEAKEAEIEQIYIKEHGIVNEGGSTPEVIFMIDDEATFDKANAEVSKLVEASGLWAKILKARDDLKTAEDELIKYGLSIAPKHEREALTKATKTNYTTRRKIIDLVFKLDAKTVRV
ncbi:MAG: hypothetical protein GXY86_11835 [Firmicutes bacterium]|nr:hypothetical protein [Bacillota bacterium]